MLNLTIEGDCPSKKNSRAFGTANGRIMSFPGSKYRQWHRDASKLLMAFKKNFLPLEEVVRIELEFYPQTKRRGDLTNKAESIMDLLVDNGFLKDDTWFVVPEITLKFGGVDPENPRVEIKIV